MMRGAPVEIKRALVLALPRSRRVPNAFPRRSERVFPDGFSAFPHRIFVAVTGPSAHPRAIAFSAAFPREIRVFPENFYPVFLRK